MLNEIRYQLRVNYYLIRLKVLLLRRHISREIYDEARKTALDYDRNRNRRKP